MTYRLQQWPERHRTLLGVIFLLVIATVLFGMMRLHPTWVAYDEARSDHARVEKKLEESQWPRDSERMRKLLDNYQAILNGRKGGDPGLKKNVADAMKKATSMFEVQIKKEYGVSPEDSGIVNFMEKASQIEYKDQFNRLYTELEGKGVRLDQPVFGMDESTSEPFKYQMRLKLWTVEALANLVLKNNLRFTRESGAGSRSRNNPSMITVLPMRAYVIDKNDKAPYLLEFPVRMEIQGSMANFANFVNALQEEGVFLPMSQMEMRTVLPNLRQPPKANQDDEMVLQNVVVTVVCSAFFRPHGEAVKMEVKQKREMLPRGA
ncbi:MAG: hypothetical protein GX937_04970 [Lentisphaerae bacterium]|jgi:hypothetical protein|nr:hypothetical protein [Lentisphaerota bacterium]